MELQGRVALVTGGAGGIGGAVVRGLAKAGISGMAINYRKSARKPRSSPLRSNAQGVNAMAIQADVQNDAQVRDDDENHREQIRPPRCRRQ